MGSKLAIWDWILGSLVLSNAVGKIKFGIGSNNSNYDSFVKNLLNPFRNLVKPILKSPNVLKNED
tara:strand:+ start:161 stop:355 length:195 start_codon:yes stop_codon:yes gene_type:complete